MAEDNNKIITRIQNRRGLKQDLPKPLRPGELGFATDTRQVYIGADTSVISDSYNKVAKFESGLSVSAESVTRSLSNVQMIQFSVPHKRFPRNNFDGTVSSTTWTPLSNAIQGSNSIGPVFATGETIFTDISTNVAFGNESMRVVKNGVLLVADTSGGSHTGISSGADYFFDAAGTTETDVHKLSFRTRPTNKDEIGITYYGNSDVWSAIDSNLQDINPSQPTGVPPFHVRLDPEWNTSDGTSSRLQHRFLDQKNIVLSSSTGKGFMGLSPKHTVVATEVKHPPAEVAQWDQVNVPLGTLYLSRNRTISASSALTASGSTGLYNIAIGAIDESNFSSTGGYLNSNLTTGTGWLDGKVLPYTKSGSVITVDTTGNVGFIGRQVTSVQTSSTLRLADASGIDTTDSIYIYDTLNGTGQQGVVADVVSLPGGGVVELNLANLSTSVGSSEIYAIVYKGGSSNNILIDEISHGYDGFDVNVNGPDGLSGTFTTTKLTEDCFTIDVTSSGTTVVSPGQVTLRPSISPTNVFVTPVTAVDVSGNVDLDSVVTHVNESISKFKMNFVPGSATRVYITENESESKLSNGFRIHDDANQTASKYLNVIPDNYTRDNSTVKSKLENWLLDFQNASTNMFTEIAINEFYNTDASVSPKFKSGGWNFAGIDSSLKEVRFESSEEARNFTKVLNNIYFDSESPEVKGLLNVKTNIELLTLETQEAGTADTIFSSPEAFAILPGGPFPGTVSNLTFDVTRYDTIFIEYALVDKDSDANPDTTYKRIGTLLATADTRSGVALVNDTYSDTSANTVGNITITGSVIPNGDDHQLQLQFRNTLVPSTEVQMTYIKRSWDSQG